MISAISMFRRVVRALWHAVREEAFLPVLSAGALLVTRGAVTL